MSSYDWQSVKLYLTMKSDYTERLTLELTKLLENVLCDKSWLSDNTFDARARNAIYAGNITTDVYWHLLCIKYKNAKIKLIKKARKGSF